MKQLVSLLALSLSACALDAPDTGTEAEDVVGSDSAAITQYRVQSAVIYSNATGAGTPICTATVVGPRAVVTALSCNPVVGNMVAPYDEIGTGPDVAHGALITTVNHESGTSASGADYTNSAGLWSDLAVLSLDTSLLGAMPALLTQDSPTHVVSLREVGAGSDSAGSNTAAALRQVSTTDTSGDDSGGDLFGVALYSTTRDRGGALYDSDNLVGVIASSVGYLQDHFTSVAAHLDWIVSYAGFIGRTQPEVANSAVSGYISSAYYGVSNATCRLSCQQWNLCQSYTYQPSDGSCFLSGNAPSFVSYPGRNSGVNYGNRSESHGSDPSGDVRSDGYTSIDHVTSTGAIDEFYRSTSASFSLGYPSGIAGAPAAYGGIAAFVRQDGINTMMYRSTSNHLIQLSLNPGWAARDLSTDLSLPSVVSAPSAIIRNDGVDSIVYRTSTGHLVEVAHASGSHFTTRDLTSAASASVYSVTDAAQYINSWDGSSRTVYLGTDGHVHDIVQATGETALSTNDLTSLAGSANAVSRPVPFTDHYGYPSLAYVTADLHLHFLQLLGYTGWHDLDVTTSYGADTVAGSITAFRRSDGRVSVLYRSSVSGRANHVAEVLSNTSNTGFTHDDVTVLAGATANLPNVDLGALVAADGVSTVTYETSAGHLIALQLIGTSWTYMDLTAGLGETP